MHHRQARVGVALLALALALEGGAGRWAAPPPDALAGPLHQAATATPTPGPPLIPESAAGMVPGEVVVRFRHDVAARAVSPVRAQAILRPAGIPATIRRALPAGNAYVIGVTPGQEAAAAAVLQTAPDVIAADPNLIRHIHGLPIPAPNDPLYPAQWGLSRINAPPAWTFPQTGLVTVAVLDTGVDLNHPEFAGRLVPGANFVAPGALPQDDNGHGTHVAGIVGAAGNNGVGGVGVAWQARIMPVKVADSSGSLTSEAWLNGLAFAVQNGAQVVNLSFGGTTFSGTEQAYIDDAWNRGAVVVASAGNSGDTGNPIQYPAAYNNVVSVAATGIDNSHAYYSESNRYVSVAAPGGDAHYGNDPNERFIISTWPQAITSNFQTGYARAIGTSQAAPFVTGLAALMFSTAQGWTNRSVVERIESTATDLGPPGRDDQFGFGLINVAAAVGNPPGPAVAVPTTTPAPPPPPPTRTAVPPTWTALPSPTLPPAPPVSPTPAVLSGCIFADVCPGAEPSAPFVQDLLRRGTLGGFGDNTFRPGARVRRAQLAKIAVLASGFSLTSLSGPHFADVPPTDPAYPYVETAYADGLMAGYGDGTFRPYGPVTRSQLAKVVVLMRGWQLVDPGFTSFTDVPYGTAFYFYIETASNLQVMAAFEDRSFHPDALLSRADAATVVDLALATFRPGSGGSFGGPLSQGPRP